jgi:hypothetical protein
MSLIRVLLAGTLQSGKTTLLESWTGLRGAPPGTSTKRPFESGARWGQLPVHIRDTPAIDALTQDYPLLQQVAQQQPHVIILLGYYANHPLASALAALVTTTNIPILVLLGKSDRFLVERRSLAGAREALEERRENARVELSAMHPSIARGFGNRRIEVQNAITEVSDLYATVLAKAEQQSPETKREIYDQGRIREWILHMTERKREMAPVSYGC